HRGEHFVVFGEEDVFLRTETTEQATPAHTARCGHTVHGRGVETMIGEQSHGPQHDLACRHAHAGLPSHDAKVSDPVCVLLPHHLLFWHLMPCSGTRCQVRGE